MPMPEGSQLNQNVSGVLTTVALSFIPKMDAFVGKNIFPFVPVGAQTAQFNIWKQGDFLRRQMRALGNAEPTPRAGFSTGTGTYKTAKYGIGTSYTAQDLAEARRGGLSDQMLVNNKTYFVTFQAMLELEMQVANIVQTSGNWTTVLSGVTSAAVLGTSFLQWDLPSSQPIDDVMAAREAMRLLTGFAPNKMVMGQQVWLALRKNPQLISRIVYSGTQEKPTEITLQLLKALFEMDDIQVGTQVYNTTPEGQADSFSYIWGKYVWLGYVTDAPSIDNPSAGYTFGWVGAATAGLPQGAAAGPGPNDFGSTPNADVPGLFIREYPENNPAQMVIESQLWATPNAVSASLGTLMTGVIS